MLWAFVFAWHFQYTSRPVFKAGFKPKLWMLATVYGLAFAILSHALVDPALRRIMPADYPSDVASWLARSSFQILFVPLFICFAPFAFFMRMTRRQTLATSL